MRSALCCGDGLGEVGWGYLGRAGLELGVGVAYCMNAKGRSSLPAVEVALYILSLVSST